MILTINQTISVSESKKIASTDRKKRNAKKYQQSGWNFFQKIVKGTGSNNCEQGGKKLQNS
jgi:hypothetical protein